MIGVYGSGAFGTALAVAWAKAGREVTLFGRRDGRINGEMDRLPGVALPENLQFTTIQKDLNASEILVLATPMQQLTTVMSALDFEPPVALAVCKGIDLKSLRGPTALINEIWPQASAMVLSGPSFAADIARDKPTALSIASRASSERLTFAQNMLSTPTLRVYRSDDPLGVELGGALKNVVAIACGAAIGAGFGESARAALMTRGFAEVSRLAEALGAKKETLAGLSGFGDLALTCTSEQSRNYRYGLSLGRREAGQPMETTEGHSTAQAVMRLAQQHKIDMPITGAVAALILGQVTLHDIRATLLDRALTKE